MTTVNEYLRSEQGIVLPSLVRAAVEEALVSAQAELEASLSIEYDRKGYPTRSNVDILSPYRSHGSDTVVLTLEVRVPEYALDFHPFLSDLVVQSIQGIENSRRAELEARKAAALAELEAVEKELAD